MWTVPWRQGATAKPFGKTYEVLSSTDCIAEFYFLISPHAARQCGHTKLEVTKVFPGHCSTSMHRSQMTLVHVGFVHENGCGDSRARRLLHR